MAAVIRTAFLAALLAVGCHAAPAESRIIESREDPGVKITYRAVPNTICETVPGVKSYSGYIDIPATLDPAFQPYNASLFFWFFESRVAPSIAPLTLWLQGGPGESTISQAVSGHNGPCIVQRDSNSTKLNPWSWNNVSNMLYIDQPVQTGFSYDSIVDGFRDMLSGDISPGGTGPSTVTNRRGKFSSQSPANTANTTAVAAKAVSHFLDLWFDQYSQYKRDKINVWSQSYGGHWAPAIATLLLQQGKIGVNSVGIFNGQIDALLQARYWPDFAVNNTYGIKAYPDAVAAAAVANFDQPGGCRDQGDACRALQAASDPNNYGTNATVNGVCALAVQYCLENVYGPYVAFSGRSQYDIADVLPISFPPPYAIGYLNNDWVQNALGAKVNFTERTSLVNGINFAAGDPARRYTGEIGTLLDAGVKVALLHGDRDYLCNWLGGEAISLAVPYSRSGQFAAAGYRPLVGLPGSTAVLGQVRQHGGFAFARVYQAGHEAPYYAPALAFALYERTVLGLDLATGLTPVVVVGGGSSSNMYSTTGPATVRDVHLVAPAGPANFDAALVECYVDAAPLDEDSRCTQAQLDALAAGTAVVDAERVVVQPAA